MFLVAMNKKKPYNVPIHIPEINPESLGLDPLGNLSFSEVRYPTEDGDYKLLGYRGYFSLDGKNYVVEGESIEEVLQRLRKIEIK
jgi:hypothetical protein